MFRSVLRVSPSILCLLPLAWLWFRVVDQLRVQWSVNPQYAYGWAVPFLCLYLVWRKADSRKQKAERTSNAEKLKTETLKNHDSESRTCFSFSAFQLFSVFLLALLYLPTRLIQEANPEWSLVSWALALEAIGITLLVLKAIYKTEIGKAESRNVAGKAEILKAEMLKLEAVSFSDFVFPVFFFLVAVPWPYLVANPVIQGLTRLNTSLTIGILDWLNVPALQRGNVIEVGTGQVGIDEACSGIRSLQATLMLSLFFGEFYRLRAWRRVLLVFSGFGLACLFNVGRTTLLTWVAARDGVGAISHWHDPAGVTILVGCFVGLWVVAKAFGGKAETLKTEMLKSEGTEGKAESTKGKAEMLKSEGSQWSVVSGPSSVVNSLPVRAFSFSAFQLFSVFFTAWLLLVEVGVVLWYRHVEAGLPAQPAWHVVWPVQQAEFRDVPIAQPATAMLRYDEARQAQWTGADGTRWQLSWFRWKPGRSAGYLAKSHNPLVCMPAVGYSVSAVSSPQFADISGLRLPFRIYSFEQEGNAISVLYSRWDDRAAEQSFGVEGVTRFNRLRSILSGRGNQGQRVISLAAWGVQDGEPAKERLLSQLGKILKPNAEILKR